MGVTWSLAPPTHLHPQARGGPRWRRVGCSQDGGGTGQPLGHLSSVTLSSARGSSDSPPLPPTQLSWSEGGDREHPAASLQ